MSIGTNQWPGRLEAPISVYDQANAIAAHLSNNYAEPAGGKVKVLANMRHLWEELYLQDETPRIFVLFNGEQARGGFNVANTLHRVDRQWQVVILRGHGWKNLMPDPNEDPSKESFLTTVEAVRDWIRVLTSVSEEFPIDYKGIDTLPNIAPTKEANVFMDCYVIRFSTANDIPAITTTQQ